jgi:FKBP-type peptidyl-prolyl cis-trans isomerase SlyD
MTFPCAKIGSAGRPVGNLKEWCLMSEENISVADNNVVSVAFVLQLDDGRVLDESTDDAPFEYIHGAGQIIPGLENALDGMSIGDEKDVAVKPDDGYGEYDPDDVVEVPRGNFPDTLDLSIGKPMKVKDSDSGESFNAYVIESNPETVTLDFNHPLAGKTLNFQVKIVGLREATAEELAHGHVHGEDKS